LQQHCSKAAAAIIIIIIMMIILYCRRRHNHSHSHRHRHPRCNYNHCGIIISLLLLIFISTSLSPPSLLSSSSWNNNVFVKAAAAAAANTKTETNLYKILGVSSKATIKEIKKAYRVKALDTHPDKNKNIPPEEAAEQFQKVVHAFEVLSDVGSRKQYDMTGRAGSATDTGSGGNGGGGSTGGGGGGGNAGGGGFHWQFRWNTGGGQRQQYKRPKLKDRFDVKEAQSRILHIVSLEQLETIITDDDIYGVLERNLLICFYTPPLEEHVMNEMVYPWPFAAKSTQGIWWEDLLQTTVVRYHRSNKITEFFHIPIGNELKEPIFIFGKRGTKFNDLGGSNTNTNIQGQDQNANNNNRLQTNKRAVFDKWVWTQLQVQVTFINNHNSPIELYWIHDGNAKLKNIIKNDESINLTTMLSHEWWVRDTKTDTRKESIGRLGRYKLHNNTCLYSIKIISDTRTKYTIPLRKCYDLSGHCTFWNRDGKECKRNPIFMNENCPLTCELCIKDDQDDDDEDEYHDDNNEDNEEEKKKKDDGNDKNHRDGGGGGDDEL
jgi:curved DNA-binding protein CbpA